jgi:hypothetical protein
MFELIGFWTAVTVIVLALLFPAILLGIWILSILVEHAIPDGRAASKASDWLVEQEYCDYTWFGGKITLNELPVWCVTFIFIIADVVLGVALSREYGSLSVSNLIHLVSEVSVFLSPFFAWVGNIVLFYVAAFYAIRYGYKASVFTSEVKDHMQDKNKHNQ